MSKTALIQARLTEPEKLELERLAKRCGLPQSQLIRRAIQQFVRGVKKTGRMEVMVFEDPPDYPGNGDKK